MSKKVLIISTSLRPDSNSECLAQEFARGAKEAGNSVEILSLRGKKISFCMGCFACLEKGSCVIKDDAVAIEEKALAADVIVWASPIYYYEMAGQMKTLIDRLNPMYPKEYRFRDVYFLTTAAEDEPHVPERANAGLQGWIECFEKANLKATLFCGGVNNAGEIKGNSKLKEAYEMGLAV